MSKVNTNNGKLRDEFVETMNIDENDTKETLEIFKANLEDGYKYYKDNLKEPDHYLILRNTIIKTFWRDTLMATIYCIIGEGSGVFFTYFLKIMIMYISDPEQDDIYTGMWYVFIFTGAMFLS